MSFDHTLVDSFTLEGRWGLPGWEQEKYVPGRLQHDPENGIRLELHGVFDQIKSGPMEVPPNKEVIHGVTSDGAIVTLLKCLATGMSLTFSANAGMTGVRYRAHWMIVGEHLQSFDDAVYSAISVNFYNLEEFVGLSGFQHRSTPSSISVEYTFPQALVMRLDDVEVKAEFSVRSNRSIFQREEIVQRAWLTATFPQETHFEPALAGPFSSLHYLFTLAVGCRLPFVAVEAKTERTVMNLDSGPFYPESKIFFSQTRVLPVPDREQPFFFLFTLAGLGANLSDSVNRWHQGFNTFRDALDFYFSLDPESDTDVALEHHFLSVTDAFESYHRSMGKKQFDFPEADHESRLKKVLASAPCEYRSWLEGKLEFSNEVSLRSRLKQLYDEQPEKVRGLLGKRDPFTAPIVNTRNFLIHHSPKLKPLALKGLELWLAIKKLRVGLQVCLLRQMGLPDDTVSQMIEKSRDYQVLQQYAKDGRLDARRTAHNE